MEDALCKLCSDWLIFLYVCGIDLALGLSTLNFISNTWGQINKFSSPGHLRLWCNIPSYSHSEPSGRIWCINWIVSIVHFGL